MSSTYDFKNLEREVKNLQKEYEKHLVTDCFSGIDFLYQYLLRAAGRAGDEPAEDGFGRAVGFPAGFAGQFPRFPLAARYDGYQSERSEEQQDGRDDLPLPCL